MSKVPDFRSKFASERRGNLHDAPRFPRSILLGGIVALLFLLVISALPAPPGTAAGSGNAGPALVGSASFPTPIQHVVFVLLENQPLSAVKSDGGYVWSLCSQYACDMNYYGVCHPSAPNYLALTSGQILQCGSDSYNSYGISNLGALVDAKGESWASYSESMPSLCDKISVGEYAVRHNPLMYYQTTTSSSSYCDSHMVPFPGSGVSGSPPNWATIPNFLYIDPNLLHDGHTPNSVPNTDAWVKSWLPMVQAEPWYASSVIFFVYDESSDSDVSCPGGLTGGVSTSNCGGHVYLSAVSPYTKGAGPYAVNTDHIDLLTTTEWLLGLGNTGAADAHGIAMKSMFTFGSTGPQQYTVGGWVNATNGNPIASATVKFSSSSSGSTSATTASDGSYQVQLQNGTYQVTASASGFGSASTSVPVNGNAISGLDFALTPTSAPTYTVSGWVNSTSGSPIASARVTFSSASNGSAAASTGSAGTYQVQLENGTYRASVTAAGYSGELANVTVNGVPVHGFNFALAPTPPSTFSVSGWVNSSGGSPIPSAEVSFAKSGSTTVTTSTAKNGFYQISLVNGTYQSTASALGYKNKVTSVSVNGRAVANVDFRLTRSSAPIYSVTGWVNSTAGNPLPAASVTFTPTGGANVSALVGADGTYQADLVNDTYEVTVNATGYVGQTENVTILGSNISNLDFALAPVSPPAFSIQGTVTAAGTGLALANASVVLQGKGADSTVTTNLSGSFAFVEPNGTYNLSAYAPGYVPGAMTVTVSGASVAGVDLALAYVGPPQFSLAGVVLGFPAGTPIAGATILLNGSGGPMQQAVSGSNGGFVFSLPNGTYSVSAAANGLHPGSFPAIIDGDNSSGLVLPLFPASLPIYNVSGYVLANGTAPLAEASVTVLVGTTPVTTQTTSNGSYHVNLPNGSYEIVIAAEGYAPDTSTVAVHGQPVAGENFALPWGSSSPLSVPTGFTLVSLGIGIAVVAGFVGLALWGWRSGDRVRNELPRRRR